ncbi:MAG: UvrD-helicase domain-containing protein [Bradymonadaceae bacterium]|nr:UvrD-helicase domain-containing protein [Lujinxingiaceae bacterium]
MNIFNELNAPQQEAVRHIEGPLLILAGAGSGKTRVLTSRIAHLVTEHDVHPAQILAVTFTNKAAAEMRSRVDGLLGAHYDTGQLALSTFHSLGARLLRRHARRLGLSPGFTIYDDDDQRRHIRRLLIANEQESERREIRRLQSFVEEMKNRGLTPEGAHEAAHNRIDEADVFFYERYQSALRQANCVDFGDLLLGVLELFRADPGLARSYSEQWRFLMVDEFQDTNMAQFELLTHLTTAHENLAVVGDDDQAIYGWRGATVANILDFERSFAKARVIKLEQNYRSSAAILDAANDVIRHNPRRHDKTLWTERPAGQPIAVFTAASDREEASYVAETIAQRIASGANYQDFAIFYRTNAQARLFEEQLRHHTMPHQIVGGMSFYAREEIKDLMAYLKVAINPADEVALLRVVNTPARGIGKTTIEKLNAASRVPGVNGLHRALRLLQDDETAQHDLFSPERPRPKTLEHDEAIAALVALSRAPRAGIKHFLELIESVRDDLAHFESLSTVVQNFIERAHYIEYLEASDPERAEDRARNVAELVNAIEEFERDEEAAPSALLADDDAHSEAHAFDDNLFAEAPAARLLRAFLERSALVQSNDALQEGVGSVTLMTVHGSKGLEFDTVFLVGMEDEIFPSLRDASDLEELEEERRLAYVAITRARHALYITNARRRRVYGTFKDTNPSRFLLDIAPERLVIDARSSSTMVDYTRSRAPTQAHEGLVNFGRNPMAGGVNRNLWDFDQSPEMIRGQLGRAVTQVRAQPPVDDFSQLNPAWDTDEGLNHAPAESVQWKAPERAVSHNELVGQTVTHTRFGIGTVSAVSGTGDEARLVIDFANGGEQTVIRRFVKVLG